MNIRLPDKVSFIIQKLEEAGFEAYAVGGCVRDCILGRMPDDWDITTSAGPLQVKDIFRRTIDTGIQHGTVTVMLEMEGFEVTTYRVDGEYEDGRHPSQVTFTADLLEDLKRRDFTINAMAYNDRSGIIDAFGGMGDIREGMIRAVGDPAERFTEDALRMMRAVRFSAQLGYAVEEKTKEAIRTLAPNLCRISAERIQTELLKLLVSPHPEYLRMAYETGITAQILPEFDRMMESEQIHPHHCYSVGEHTLHALPFVQADKVLRLSVLFHDIGKPDTLTVDKDGISHFHAHAKAGEAITHRILRRLKLDNDTIARVTKLVRSHDCDFALTEKSIRKAAAQTGTDMFPLLFEIKRADILAQSVYLRKEKLEAVEKAEKIYQQILADCNCLSLKELAVTGRDLIASGISPGKEIGDILGRMLEDVIETPQKNTKEYLLEKLAEYRGESDI